MKFWKLHGTGNDFILIDHTEGMGHDLSQLAKALCHRRFGIGADGLMTAASSSVADIQMLYFNSDGSPAAMCGNGIRCFAKFIRDSQLITKDHFTVETGDGVKNVFIKDQNEGLSQVSVEMGHPENIDSILFSQIAAELPEDFIHNEFIFMHFGVPHSVIFMNRCESKDQAFPELLIKASENYGPIIEKYALFPEGSNVNFVCVRDEFNLTVSTWERGAGRTWACGTGACASAVAANHLGLTAPAVRVRMPGGEVSVTIADGGTAMEGPARLICKGTFFTA